MEASELDKVRVDVAGELVEITWHERDQLLDELAFVPGSKTIREHFEAVGASRPVELDAEQRRLLSMALEEWGAHGDVRPDGLERLLEALERAATSGE
jgi:hypothetical protein